MVISALYNYIWASCDHIYLEAAWNFIETFYISVIIPYICIIRSYINHICIISKEI
jgi:hypothetical protein